MAVSVARSIIRSYSSNEEKRIENHVILFLAQRLMCLTLLLVSTAHFKWALIVEGILLKG